MSVSSSMNGIFAVRKPSGPTSQDVVSKLKHIFTKSPQYKCQANTAPQKKRGRRQNFIKIGHGGTLDPLADGTLVIGIGSGTKQLASYLGSCSKLYTATALLGFSTTTHDSQGKVLEYGKVDPASITMEKVEKILQKFRGRISQLPPVYSALKMDGKPLYEYAREGISLPRPIERRECEIIQLNAGNLRKTEFTSPALATFEEVKFAEQVTGHKPDQSIAAPDLFVSIDLTFSVSSGTYIRTLIHDIGEALGTKATMIKLTRDSQGEWVLGQNVLPLALFDKPNEIWWPVLETILKEGPKRRIEEAELKTENQISA